MEEKYLENVIAEIKDRLPEYLRMHGTKVPDSGIGKIRCVNYLNHSHGDSHPSASLTKKGNGYLLHCFTCGTNMSTIDAAYFIENLPTSGPEFITVTIPRLAFQLGIPFELKKLSKKDQDRKKCLDAIRSTSDFIIANTNQEILNRRGISAEDSVNYRIGTGSFSLMLTELRKTYPDSTLRSAGLIDGRDEAAIHSRGDDMFMTNAIIMTICDRYGNPIGFVRRDVEFETKIEKGISSSKYKNSSSNDYYNKSRTLYLVHHAAKAIGTSRSVYVFEGYIDVLTAQKNKIDNSVALGGVAFTQEHLKTLVDMGTETVILCLDNDKEGIKSTLRTIDSLFKDRKDIFLKIIVMDEKGEDPDSYIRKFGSDKFMTLRKVDYIEWSIHTSEIEQLDDAEFSRMVAEIVKYTDSPLLQNRYAKCMSDKWPDYTQNVIMEELKFATENSMSKSNLGIDKLVKEMYHQIQYISGESVIPVIEEYLYKIESKRIKVINKRVMQERELEMWDVLKENYTNQVPDPILMTCYPRMGAKFDLPKTEGLIIVGGREHHGKSTFMRQIALNIAIENKDILVLYYTLDDSKKQSVQGFLGAMCKVKMSTVRNFNTPITSDTDKTKIINGFTSMKKLSGSFKLRDSSDCRSISDIQKDILTMKTIYGSKKIQVFIDALNDLDDYNTGANKRTEVETAITKLKSMTVRYDCNIWAASHMNKTRGKKPTIDDLKETGAIAYNADVVILVYNDLVFAGSASPLKQQAPVGRSYPFYPIMEIDTCKNKLTEYRGKKMLLLHSDEGWLEELDHDNEKMYANLAESQEAKKDLVRVGARNFIQDESSSRII